EGLIRGRSWTGRLKPSRWSGFYVTELQPAPGENKKTGCNGRFLVRNTISVPSGIWSERLDSNQRPSRPERDALPSCATLRRWRAFYRNTFVSQELSVRFLNVPVPFPPAHSERLPFRAP